MNDLDRKIEEALDAEDRALMNHFGEQGLFAQTFGVFQGKIRWIAMMAVPVTLIFTLGAFYSGWMFFQSGDSVIALRWGILAWIMMSVVAFLKLWFWMRMESNRVIREIKRVELQVVRLQSKQIV